MIDKLAKEIDKLVNTSAFRHKAQEQGASADFQNPQQLAVRVKDDLVRWAGVVKASKIEAD